MLHFCGEGLGRPGRVNSNDCSYLKICIMLGTRLASFSSTLTLFWEGPDLLELRRFFELEAVG